MIKYLCDTCGRESPAPLPPTWTIITTEMLIPGPEGHPPVIRRMEHHVCDDHRPETLEAATADALQTELTKMERR